MVESPCELAKLFVSLWARPLPDCKGKRTVLEKRFETRLCDSSVLSLSGGKRASDATSCGTFLPLSRDEDSLPCLRLACTWKRELNEFTVDEVARGLGDRCLQIHPCRY